MIDQYQRYVNACRRDGLSPVSRKRFNIAVAFDTTEDAIRGLHPLRESRRIIKRLDVPPL